MRGLALTVSLLLLASGPALAEEIRVAPGGTIQAALNAALPGDLILVEAGTYNESLLTVRDGTASDPILLRAEGEVVVTNSGRVLRVEHAYVSVEGFVFDGQYGDADAIQVRDAGHFFSLLGCEVRNTSRDCIDLGSPSNVTIDGCLIHHCLNATGGRTDAHGIVGGAVRDLSILNTKVHSFSGDAVQFDPGRDDAGWSGIVIDSCEFWLEPLPVDANGFAAGTVPGENAIDTKVSTAAPRAIMTITNTRAHGFRGGLISNMAAFNMKEGVDATLDRITVYDSEIAFRIRGPETGAKILLTNALVYDVDTAVRYEDDIVSPQIYHATFGSQIGTLFDEASAAATVLGVRNSLVLAAGLPNEAMGASNLAVSESAFVDSSGSDYHLSPNSPAIDQGEEIPEVVLDRDNRPRPLGASADIGAFEYCEPDCLPLLDAGLNADATPGAEGGESGGCGCRTTGASGLGSLFWAFCLLAVIRRSCCARGHKDIASDQRPETRGQRSMVSLLLLLVASACGDSKAPALPPASENWQRDILTTDLSFQVRGLRGTARVGLAGDSSLGASLEVGDLSVRSVQLDGETLNFKHEGSQLDIGIPASETPLEIEIAFDLSAHDGFEGYRSLGSTLTWPTYCGNLFPCKSDPAEGARYTLTLDDLEPGDQAVFPAAIPADAPAYMVAFAVGEYTKLDLGQTSAGTKVSAYYLPGGLASAESGTAFLKDYVDFFERSYGSYAFGQEIASVEVNWGFGVMGGIEHHPFFHVSKSGMSSHEIQAHEAAHGWFGNGVRIACWEDLLLSEGVAQYLTLRAIEDAEGIDVANALWSTIETRLAAAVSSGDTQAYPSGCGEIDILTHPLWSRIPYEKGAFFLRAVEQRVGRTQLDAVLASFYQAHVGSAQHVSNLLDAIATQTGTNIDDLSDSWLLGLGIPSS